MRVSLVTRIFAGYFLVLCLLGGVVIYAVLAMNRMHEEVTIVKQGLLPISARLHRLSRELSQTAALADNRRCEEVLRVTPGLAELKPFATLEEVAHNLSGLSQRLQFTPEAREQFSTLAGQIRGLIEADTLARELGPVLREAQVRLPARDNRTVFAGVVERYLATGRAGDEPAAPAHLAAARALEVVTGVLSRRVKGFEATANLAINSAWGSTRSWEESSVRMGLFLGLAALAVIVAVFFLLLSWLRPLRKLRTVAQRIATGDYDQPVQVRSEDELGDLARELSKMAGRLKEREEMIHRQADELLRADRFSTIGKMSTQIAHEIRNPLNALGLKLELLEDSIEENREHLDNAGHAELTRTLTAAGKEIDRLREITDYYLKFARFPEVEKELVDLQLVLADVASFYEEEASTVGARIEREIEGPLKARADPNLIRHALANLLKNAIEATADSAPEDRLIMLQALREGNRIRITVKDTGPGMAADKVAHVFDPFFTTKKQGTGLGLTLVQQIITEHGGAISCTSTPGQGTMFKMWIPE